MSDIIKLGIRNAMITIMDPESKEPGILFRSAPPYEQPISMNDDELISKTEVILHHLLLANALSSALLAPEVSYKDLCFILKTLIQRFNELKEDISHIDTDPRNSY